MKVTNKLAAVVFSRNDVKNDGQKIEWQPLKSISQYPTILQGDFFGNCLFTSNFEKYIDVNYARGHFIIKDLMQNEEDAIEVPQDLLSIKNINNH